MLWSILDSGQYNWRNLTSWCVNQNCPVLSLRIRLYRCNTCILEQLLKAMRISEILKECRVVSFFFCQGLCTSCTTFGCKDNFTCRISVCHAEANSYMQINADWAYLDSVVLVIRRPWQFFITNAMYNFFFQKNNSGFYSSTLLGSQNQQNAVFVC